MNVLQHVASGSFMCCCLFFNTGRATVAVCSHPWEKWPHRIATIKLVTRHHSYELVNRHEEQGSSGRGPHPSPDLVIWPASHKVEHFSRKRLRPTCKTNDLPKPETPGAIQIQKHVIFVQRAQARMHCVGTLNRQAKIWLQLQKLKSRVGHRLFILQIHLQEFVLLWLSKTFC